MRRLFFAIGFLSLMACQEKEFLSPEVEETFISKNRKAEDLAFPFADLEELNQFKENSEVIHYEMARKVALLELQATGFVEKMNWNGYRLSERPIVIYDLASIPKYYDYIALDTESSPIGTVRVNATKKRSTILQGMFSKTFNYNEMASKSSVANPSFFVDWKDEQFVGIKSKSGEAPTQIVSSDTGEVLSDVKELDKQEIIQLLTTEVFPALLPKDGRPFENIPVHLIENDTIREEIEFAKAINIGIVKDSLVAAFDRSEKEAEAFWNAISEVEHEIAGATDEEINDTNSKFFGRIFRWARRVFDFNTNKNTFPIPKYADYRTIQNYGKRGNWCGPWVCGYIVYVNQGVDKYKFFEDCAGTFGEFAFFNSLLRYVDRSFGEARPMTPAEMAWSMPIASGGKIWINPLPHFASLHAYDHIRYRNKPVLRLLAANGQLHWTLACGAVANGSYLWRNYKFLQIDNGTLITDKARNINEEINYTAVQVWNPWFLVYD